MAVYRLVPDAWSAAARPGQRADAGTDSALWLRKALWFCRLRWVVVGLLGAVGLLGLISPTPAVWGLLLPGGWPWALAAVLAGFNVIYAVLLPPEGTPAPVERLRLHLWVQIVVDLLLLTLVIHFLGSLETHALYMYLFHIILACIFFPRGHSLAVTAIAALLYLGCLALEARGLLPPSSVLVYPALADRAHLPLEFWVWRTGFAFFIWAVIWHLTSQLSGMLRVREYELAVSNQRLQASVEERTRHLLQTTHQLKSPFAAVHAHLQLLLGGYCGPLPDRAMRVVGKLLERCQGLSQQIQGMLQLANLRSAVHAPPPAAETDLAEVIRDSVAGAEPTAVQRHIRIECDLQPVSVWAAREHLKVLIDNVVSNAVNYSHDGGTVAVNCSPAPGEHAVAAVRDHGIGIAADKLPHIFEDYYRTREAAEHNQASTGLGLAIVRDIARLNGITLEVESTAGQGTCFTLWLPRHPPPFTPTASSPGRPLVWHTS